MKKNYQQPVMKMVKMQSENVICAGSNVTNVNGGDTGIGYGGGGNATTTGGGPARSGSTSIWEEEETGENVEE